MQAKVARSKVRYEINGWKAQRLSTKLKSTIGEINSRILSTDQMHNKSRPLILLSHNFSLRELSLPQDD